MNKKMDVRPKCFDSDTRWEEYRSAGKASFLGPSSYCTDCTPRFKEKMMIEGRCEHPEVVFTVIFDDTGWPSMIGRRLSREQIRARLRRKAKNQEIKIPVLR